MNIMRMRKYRGRGRTAAGCVSILSRVETTKRKKPFNAILWQSSESNHGVFWASSIDADDIHKSSLHNELGLKQQIGKQR